MTGLPLLTTLTLLPTAGGLLLLLPGSGASRYARTFSLIVSLASLALALLLWKDFQPQVAGWQLEEHHAWMPALGVDYHTGIDGLGLVMIVLSTLLTPMAVAASTEVRERASLYFSLILFLETGLIGSFTTLNLVHWFLYWELSLVPAFFLIRLWGGAHRAHAAMQFFVYSIAGSIALLLSLLALGAASGTFELPQLMLLARDGQLMPLLISRLGIHAVSSQHLVQIVFLGAFLGLAVKTPVVPFHTWLPEAYAEAPSPVTMLLTGAMSKMGVYGFLRLLLPLFGEQMRALRIPLLWFAVATILLPALAAIAQRDLKRMLAYSSINHLGYCLLAIFAVAGATQPALAVTALDGAMLQMFNHGLTAALLFWFIALLERRTGHRCLNDFGGLRRAAPVFCGLMGVAIFSSLGLPGLNGFVGEFLIFKGSFAMAAAATAASTLALLATAIFLLNAMERIFWGPGGERAQGFVDLSLRERVALAVPTALLLILGLYPQLLLNVLNQTALALPSWMGR